MRTALGQVRGLGSARSGAHHWWLQRATALANLGLFVWLLAALLALPNLDYATVRGWLASPLGAVPMGLLLLSLFWHIRLGLQVAIEDYTHGVKRVAALALLNAFVFICGGLAFYALVRIALAGTVA